MNSKDKLLKPYASSLAINNKWSKVSKALDKSKNIVPIQSVESLGQVQKYSPYFISLI